MKGASEANCAPARQFSPARAGRGSIPQEGEMRKVILGTLGVWLAGVGLATAQSTKPARASAAAAAGVRPVNYEAAADPTPAPAWDKSAAGSATDHSPLPTDCGCACDAPYRLWGNFEFLVW